MAHRVGVCGSCRARFQIPSTFTPNRARCRTCGGVVEIGAGQGNPQQAPTPPRPRAETNPPARPALAEVPASLDPVEVEVRPATPTPPAIVEQVRPRSAPPAPKKRSLLVPALVAVGVLAVLIFGAFQLLGRRSSAEAGAPASENAPKAPPAPEDATTPR